MRVVLHLPGASQEQAAWLGCALSMITQLRATIEPDEESRERTSRAISSRPNVGDTSRFVVADMLGVAHGVVTDLEAAMVMTLCERGARGFDAVPDLYIVLRAYPCWSGQRHLVVATYRALRQRFATTRYRLKARGYGFEASDASGALGVVAL